MREKWSRNAESEDGNSVRVYGVKQGLCCITASCFSSQKGDITRLAENRKHFVSRVETREPELECELEAQQSGRVRRRVVL